MSARIASLKLGLIGDNIGASRSPRLHRLAGEQAGLDVTYDRLVPQERGEDFGTIVACARAAGYRGLNITYPYKEQVMALVAVDDPVVAAMGAVNTVLFEADGPRGFNTDFSGFIAAHGAVRGAAMPGPTLVIGTGGVGRAIAFALARIGAVDLRLADRDSAKAAKLAEDLAARFPGLALSTGTDAEAMAHGADGVVNCTPVGMVGYPGTPLAADAMKGAVWAFDAVYTPADTQFLCDAARLGLVTISGWELFFFQGLHAWRLFSGRDADPRALRAALQTEADLP